METEPEETEEIEEETFEGSEDANANAKSAATTTPGNAAIAAKRTTLELVASLAVPRGKPVRTSSGAASSKSGADAIDEDDDDDDDDDDVEEECDGFEAKAEGTKLRSAQDNLVSTLQVSNANYTNRTIFTNGGLQSKVQKFSNHLRRTATSSLERGEKTFTAHVVSESYECGFRKCQCRIDGEQNLVWVVLREDAKYDETEKVLRIKPPFHRHGADVYLVW